MNGSSANFRMSHSCQINFLKFLICFEKKTVLCLYSHVVKMTYEYHRLKKLKDNQSVTLICFLKYGLLLFIKHKLSQVINKVSRLFTFISWSGAINLIFFLNKHFSIIGKKCFRLIFQLCIVFSVPFLIMRWEIGSIHPKLRPEQKKTHSV